MLASLFKPTQQLTATDAVEVLEEAKKAKEERGIGLEAGGDGEPGKAEADDLQQY